MPLSQTPSVVVREWVEGKPYFEAKWRDARGRQRKRRLGQAWVEPDGEGGWKKRRGRVPDGWLDEREAQVLAAAEVAEVERRAHRC